MSDIRSFLIFRVIWARKSLFLRLPCVKMIIRIALEITRLQVNHRLFPLLIQPKSISLEQSYYERSQAVVVNLLYDVKKQT